VHKESGLLVAIKIYDKYKLSDPARKKAVVREITVFKRLDHPNLPKLLDVVDSPSQVYLVMEYVLGTNLKTFLQLPLSEHVSLLE